MQEEALLPRMFYMREWLTYGCVGGGAWYCGGCALLLHTRRHTRAHTRAGVVCSASAEVPFGFTSLVQQCTHYYFLPVCVGNANKLVHHGLMLFAQSCFIIKG